MTQLQVTAVSPDTGVQWTLIEDRASGEDDMTFFRRVSAMAQAMNLVAPELRRHKVDVVVRREQENQDGTVTDAVDFYAPWNKDGTFGQYKVYTAYLNSDSDRERFEAATGLVLEDLEVLKGPPGQRKFGGKRKSYEYEPEYDVTIVLEPRGQKKLSDGRMVPNYHLLGYETDAPGE